MFCFWLNMSLKSKQHFLSKWKLTLKTPKYSTFWQCGINLSIFHTIVTTRDLILFSKIQKIPHLGFERGLESLSIQIKECELALILVFCLIDLQTIPMTIKDQILFKNAEKLPHWHYERHIRCQRIHKNIFVFPLIYKNCLPNIQKMAISIKKSKQACFCFFGAYSINNGDCVTQTASLKKMASRSFAPRA